MSLGSVTDGTRPTSASTKLKKISRALRTRNWQEAKRREYEAPEMDNWRMPERAAELDAIRTETQAQGP